MSSRGGPKKPRSRRQITVHPNFGHPKSIELPHRLQAIAKAEKYGTVEVCLVYTPQLEAHSDTSIQAVVHYQLGVGDGMIT